MTKSKPARRVHTLPCMIHVTDIPRSSLPAVPPFRGLSSGVSPCSFCISAWFQQPFKTRPAIITTRIHSLISMSSAEPDEWTALLDGSDANSTRQNSHPQAYAPPNVPEEITEPSNARLALVLGSIWVGLVPELETMLYNRFWVKYSHWICVYGSVLDHVLCTFVPPATWQFSHSGWPTIYPAECRNRNGSPLHWNHYSCHRQLPLAKHRDTNSSSRLLCSIRNNGTKHTTLVSICLPGSLRSGLWEYARGYLDWTHQLRGSPASSSRHISIICILINGIYNWADNLLGRLPEYA